MKNLYKKDLLKETDQSAEELHQKVGRHRALMAAVLEEGFNERTLKQPLYLIILLWQMAGMTALLHWGRSP
ncbi:MAG: hypothetical protein JRJ15_09705 [Deltaproteobacteria bacterium]|nr:hypothetical protein [Deltaproteobacteria bacterium]